MLHYQMYLEMVVEEASLKVLVSSYFHFGGIWKLMELEAEGEVCCRFCHQVYQQLHKL